jgi:hypothetical protein
MAERQEVKIVLADPVDFAERNLRYLRNLRENVDLNHY